MPIRVRTKEFKVSAGRYNSFWQQVAMGRQHCYIDVGAWIGPTLLYGCQLAKMAYGLEPDPIAFAELEQHRPEPGNPRQHSAAPGMHRPENRTGCLRQPRPGRRLHLQPAIWQQENPLDRP